MRRAGAMILERLSRTLRVYILDDFHADASGPRHEASEASDAIPRGAESERASQANRAARCPSCPAAASEARGCADGAMVLSQDEIDGSAPASLAVLRLLSS